jgi:Fic family protein
MNTLFKDIDQHQKRINAMRPLPKELVTQIQAYYKVGLTYSSNALEGNSLTETETKVILEDGITIGGKPLKDHYEALGHAEAYDFLYTLAKAKSIAEADIKNLHKLFYKRIDEKNAGVYRKARALITGSKYPLPTPDQIPALMKSLMPKIRKWRKDKHPVEVAALAHKEFVFIHPFVDGNGRVARLLTNLLLVQEGYNIVIIPPVIRRDYIASLEKAHTDDKDFIALIARAVLETQMDYLRMLRA